MKNKITAIIIFIIVFVLAAAVFSLSIYSFKLQGLVDKQNKSLENYSKIDSLYNSGHDDIVNSITKFFENAPTYIDGEPVSAIDFVAYHDRILDSLQLYRDYYEFSQDRYGVSLKKIFPSDSTYRIVSDPPTRADSASYLIPYYNHLVYREDNKWYTITTDYKTMYEEMLKKYNDLSTECNENVRKSLDVVREYSDLLQKLKDDGLIELDTTENEIQDTVN